MTGQPMGSGRQVGGSLVFHQGSGEKATVKERRRRNLILTNLVVKMHV